MFALQVEGTSGARLLSEGLRQDIEVHRATVMSPTL